ncbi:MAG: adenylate kinase [Syntrophomonadaceae bacterium]|nr:adenylate kinase [Syntrophomonadaceae bacterium]
MNIILLGPPGAGKGTQAEFIKANYPILHISTGDMFREAVGNKTAMGLEAKKYMDAGQLVPDEVTIGVVEERLSQPDCSNGFLLDGFPRTIPQAEALDKVMAGLGKRVDLALEITVPDSIIIERMTGRVSCSQCKAVYNTNFNPPVKAGICDKCGGELVQRSDDKEETVKNRLQVYAEQTQPLLGYYEKAGKLKSLDGNRDPQVVFKDVQSLLEKF